MREECSLNRRIDKADAADPDGAARFDLKTALTGVVLDCDKEQPEI